MTEYRQLAHLTSVLASGGPLLAEHLASLGNPTDDPQVETLICRRYRFLIPVCCSTN